MLRELADLQFSETEFQTAGALTEKALADKANVTLARDCLSTIDAVCKQAAIIHCTQLQPHSPLLSTPTVIV